MELSSGHSRCGAFGNTLRQTRNRVRHLRALASPVRETILSDAHILCAFFADWVVETKTLNVATIATITRISNNDIEERGTFGTTTRKIIALIWQTAELRTEK